MSKVSSKTLDLKGIYPSQNLKISPNSQGAQDMQQPLLENQGHQAKEERKSIASSKNQSPQKIQRKYSTSPNRMSEAGNILQTGKLLTVIERKITHVPHDEFIKKSDVTLGDRNKLLILTILNLVIYICQMATIIVTAIVNNVQLSIFQSQETPITISQFFLIWQWILVFLLQFFFVVLPLPCMKPGQHYQNIILRRVKESFAVLCFLQTIAIIAFTSYAEFSQYFLPFGLFFALKVYMHIKTYRKVIYKDDGRDYVSKKEFFSIHVTFSVLHSWVTYFCIFNFFKSMTDLMNFQVGDHNKDAEFWTVNIELWGVLAMVVMVLEMTIYLAYYKDIIFSLITLLNLVGMYIHNQQSQVFTTYISNCLIALISISSFFILMTLIYDYDKAFYMKHQFYERKFKKAEKKAELKLNQKSKVSMQSNRKDTEAYERSQSFAVWLQFQQIQQRHLREDTDDMSMTDEGDQDMMRFDTQGQLQNKNNDSKIEDLLIQEIEEAELQDAKHSSFVQSEVQQNKSSRFDMFESKTKKRQAKQANTVLKNPFKKSQNRKTAQLIRSQHKQVQSKKSLDNQTLSKPSITTVRDNYEDRLQTNQRDESYVQTVVEGPPKGMNRNPSNLNQHRKNYNDSCSMIQDEVKFLRDQDEVSNAGCDSKSSQRHQTIQGMQSSHLLKMISTDAKINYSNQNLSEIPNQLLTGIFNQLGHLDLSSNLISQISDNFIQCIPNVKTLILSSNKINFLNPQIKRLKQLQILRLNSNSLSMLPNEIGELTHLQEIDVSDNKLFGLPDSIENLKNIKVLNISMNQIRCLPPELDQLTKLENFYIDNNLFTSFPCSFGRLKNLKEFSLEWVKYMYADPPLPQIISTDTDEGKAFMEILRKLCQTLVYNDKFECDFVDFLRYVNESMTFSLNQIDSRQRTILHNACGHGDLGVIKSLVLSGIDLNILDKDDCTALCIAIRELKFEAAKILIEAGADVNIGGGIYGSALHLAVVRNNQLLTDMMIKRGAEVNVADAEGNTPLHFIMNVFSKSETKYKAIAESLVMSGSRPNQRNRDLWSPLHVAAKKGQIEAIRWVKMVNEILRELQMETFDFNMPGGQQKWTPLHLAGYSGHYKVVEEILNGSLESLRKFPINVYARNIDFKTPRQCTKGNLVLTKIFRKAEKRYLKEIFEIENITESHLIINHHLPIKQRLRHQSGTPVRQKQQPIDDTGYLSLMDQLSAIKKQNKHNSKLKQRNPPEFKKLNHKQILEKSLRLEQSRIIDIPETDEEDEETENLNYDKQNKKSFVLNDLRKNIFKGDTDKNSVFIDLMKTMSPRTLGQKLSFYQGKNAVIAGIDLKKFQKQLNDSIMIQNETKLKNKQLLFSPKTGKHINIFYLKDKIIDNQTVHEKLEALSILHKENKHSNYDQMLKQMIERLPQVILQVQNRCILDELIKLVTSRGSLECLDLAIKQLQNLIQNKDQIDTLIQEDLEDYLQDLLTARVMQQRLQLRVNPDKYSNQSTQRNFNFNNPTTTVQNHGKILQHTQSFNANRSNKELAIIDFHQNNKNNGSSENGQYQQIRRGPGSGMIGTTNLSGKNLLIGSQGNKITQKINETPKLLNERNKYFGE